jgi:hypothetical protein
MEDLYLKSLEQYLTKVFNKLHKNLEKGIKDINKPDKNPIKFKSLSIVFFKALLTLTALEQTSLKMAYKERLCIGQNNIARPFIKNGFNLFFTQTAGLINPLFNFNDKNTNNKNTNNNESKAIVTEKIKNAFDSACINFFENNIKSVMEPQALDDQVNSNNIQGANTHIMPEAPLIKNIDPQKRVLKNHVISDELL